MREKLKKKKKSEVKKKAYLCICSSFGESVINNL